MENRNTNFTPNESLLLINEMIHQAKKSYEVKSFYFLLWGWLLTLTGIGVYVLASSYPQFANWLWFAQSIIGGIVATIYSIRKGKVKPVSSHMNKFIKDIWIGYGITLFIIIFLAGQNAINPIPFILLLTGLPTFLSGRTLQFLPLTCGGICFWIFGIASIFVTQMNSLLLFSAAILVGYLIPGYLLKLNEKGRNRV